RELRDGGFLGPPARPTGTPRPGAGPVERGARDARIECVPRDGELRLSFAQERLWFLAQLEPEATFHNVCIAGELAGELDGAALRRSLQEIVHRHESLRTVFSSVEGRPRQVILPALTLDCPTIDLSAE